MSATFNPTKSKISGESVVVSSGQIDIRSGVPIIVNISGDIVRALISGDIIVGKISGERVETHVMSGQITVDPVTSSGLHVVTQVNAQVDISGDPVVVSSGVVRALISGDTVQINSGLPVVNQSHSGEGVTLASGLGGVSGQFVNARISGTVATSVSGNIVRALVSGDHIIAHNSGEVVGIVNGLGQILNVKFTSPQAVTTSVSGNIVSIDQSGLNIQVDISGDPVSISGQPVKISGESITIGAATIQVPVDIQGRAAGFALISGEPVTVSGNAITNSGNIIRAFISGDSITNSGNVVRIADSGGNMFAAGIPSVDGFSASVTNRGLNTMAFNLGYNNDDGNWKRIRVNQSGELTSKVSGETVRSLVSGDIVIAKVSGETISIASGAYLASGLRVIVESGLGVSIASGLHVVADVNAQVDVSGDPVSVGIYEPVAVSRNSGDYSSLKVDSDGALIVRNSGQQIRSLVSGDFVSMLGTRISGAVQVSGILGISGNVQVLSGRIAVTSGLVGILSGNIYPAIYEPVDVTRSSGQFNAMKIDSIGRVYTISEISGGIIVSGTVNASVSGNIIRSLISGDYINLLGTQISGTIAVSGTVIAKVSGEIVTIASGAVVQIDSLSGDSILVAVYEPVAVTRASGLPSLILTDINGRVIARISGDTLIAKVSGETVRALISGDMVTISNAGIQISGAVQVSGIVTSKISGENVVISSGVVQAYISGTVVSTVSGNIIRSLISGDSVITSISGNAQTIYQPDISGTMRAITSTSGSTPALAVALMNSSGQVAAVQTPGDGYTNSNILLHTAAFGVLYDADANRWNRSRTNKSGQGVTTVATSGSDYIWSYIVSGNLATSVSGNIIRALVSGDTVTISNAGIQVSGAVIISGNVGTSVSGNQIRALISGDFVQLLGTRVSGAVQVSGIVGVSGSVSILSGLVAILSGNINTSVSGNQIRALISGDYINLLGTQVSGSVQVSGTVTAKVSGELVSIISNSGDYVGITGTITIGGSTIQVPIDIQGRAAGFALISGEPVTVSGNIIRSLISGDFVNATISGTVNASVSGNIVRALVSGDIITISNTGIQVSGAVIISGDVNTSVSGNQVRALVSGDFIQLLGTRVSGAVQVSGTVAVSGVVYITGESGDRVPGVYQYGSGSVTSGIIGGFVVAPAIFEGSTVTRLSGQPSNLRIDSTGKLISSSSGDIYRSLISGDTVTISNAGIQVSGAVIVSGNVGTSVSGNIIRALISGDTVTISNAGIQVSGAVIISGDVNTTVSGNIIRALISGDYVTTVTSISGNIVRALVSGDIVNVSGQVMRIAGDDGRIVPQVTQNTSGSIMSGSIGALVIAPAIFPGATITRSSGQSSPLTIQANGDLNVTGSGDQMRALTSGDFHFILGTRVSGAVIVSGNVGTSVSGNQIRALVSGDYVQALVSGLIIAKVSGEAVNTSGQPTATPTKGRIRDVLTLDNNSGGILLSSGDCITMVVRAINSNSGDIYLGYDNPNTERPYSGHGIILSAGDAISIDIDNFNRVRVFGTISGFCRVTYGGAQL